MAISLLNYYWGCMVSFGNVAFTGQLHLQTSRFDDYFTVHVVVSEPSTYGGSYNLHSIKHRFIYLINLLALIPCTDATSVDCLVHFSRYHLSRYCCCIPPWLMAATYTFGDKYHHSFVAPKTWWSSVQLVSLLSSRVVHVHCET